jgi:protein-disulfide isomerase
MHALAVCLAVLLSFVCAVPLAASEVPIEIGNARGEIDKAAYFKPGLAPVRQPAHYGVTVVYFFDYQCPACRKYSPDVARAFKDEPNVRVIYRDTPIFGPRSEAAARVAIASQYQGKHEAMHRALMQASMPLDDHSIRAAADKAGVDWDRLQRDLKERGKDIDLQVAWNAELAQSAGIRGTPAFVIGDTLADGVLDYAGVRGSIADARRAGGATARTQVDAAALQAGKRANEKAADDKEPIDGKPPARPETAATAPVAFEKAPAREPADQPSSRMATPGWLWAGLLAAIAGSAVVLLRRRRA